MTIGLAVALVTAVVSSFLGGYLQPADTELSTLVFILVFAAAVIFFVLPFLDQGGWYRLHGPDQRYLTAWTVSGWRTVDLHRLVRIRRFSSLADGRKNVDMLVLTDVDGVRLMLDKEEVDRAAQRALAEHPTSGLDVSLAVQHRFGTFEPPPKLRSWWLLRRIGYPFVVYPLSLAVSVLLAMAGYAVSTL